MSDLKSTRHESDEHSIRARKSQLFEARPDDGLALGASRKAFEEMLREVPAAPLPTATKAMLWGVGLLVAGLLAATIVSISAGGKGKEKSNPPDRPPISDGRAG